jgi:hypothetical protein
MSSRWIVDDDDGACRSQPAGEVEVDGEQGCSLRVVLLNDNESVHLADTTCEQRLRLLFNQPTLTLPTRRSATERGTSAVAEGRATGA